MARGAGFGAERLALLGRLTARVPDAVRFAALAWIARRAFGAGGVVFFFDAVAVAVDLEGAFDFAVFFIGASLVRRPG
jgi:hypothetical protein